MSLLDEVDNLFEWAVREPTTLSEAALSDWVQDISGSHRLDREGAKHIRRCLNAARKLAVFWSERTSGEDYPEDWRSRVDLSLGVRAWRPQLDLAWYLLEDAEEEEIFEHASTLFRIVNNELFLDGASYQDWLETRQ